MVNKKFSLNKVLYPYQLQAIEKAYEFLKTTRIPNRVSFWMATGSGKTLVIVKLIELLKNMMDSREIPKKDILFLTAREDLVEQFLKHVEEYNEANRIKIIAYSLKDYEKIKSSPVLEFPNRQIIYYYRSDLISDENKDKIVDYKTYDNGGNWYIILDEAHKGDKQESKRQQAFSYMTRNGILFNFSATFTDKIDLDTCIFNFNLEQFVKQGYGKDIYVSEYDIKDLSSKDDWTQEKKREITLRILVLLSALKKVKQKLKDYYHKPMLIVLVNSVNTEDSDLEMFFRVLEEIAQKPIEENLLEKIKRDLIEELRFAKTEFTNKEMPISLLDEIESITSEDILLNVFNTGSPGKIEVKILPNNKQELALSLKTSTRPFALIKIGDITGWIKEKLKGYEITETFENESLFKRINDDDSEINILLGSRSFYEGWDSDRPNIILYINIGKQDAKKFVLQSVGRGVRVSPIKNKRGRWERLKKEIPHEDYERLKEYVPPLETLFVYGTKASNLKEIIEAVRSIKTEENISDMFIKNPSIEGKPLLIPTYKQEEPLWFKNNGLIKFTISQKDLNLLRSYIECVPDIVLIVRHDIKPSMLRKIKESLQETDKYYKIDNEYTLSKPEFIMRSLIMHFSTRMESFKEFKPIEDEIIHFKHITVSKDKAIKIKEAIKKAERQKVGYYRDKDTKINIDFKYVLPHYYLPLAVSDSKKADFIKHIIKEESEREFIEHLENYVEDNQDLLDELFEWWYFSKIDETLDEVYIPYYNPSKNKIEKFKPDFIFWFKLKDRNELIILFVDPKSPNFRDADIKLKGYIDMFEENGKEKEFNVDGLKVKVLLRMFSNQVEKTVFVQKYWIDDIGKVIEYLKVC